MLFDNQKNMTQLNTSTNLHIYSFIADNTNPYKHIYGILFLHSNNSTTQSKDNQQPPNLNPIFNPSAKFPHSTLSRQSARRPQ